IARKTVFRPLQRGLFLPKRNPPLPRTPPFFFFSNSNALDAFRDGRRKARPKFGFAARGADFRFVAHCAAPSWQLFALQDCPRRKTRLAGFSRTRPAPRARRMSANTLTSRLACLRNSHLC